MWSTYRMSTLLSIFVATGGDAARLYKIDSRIYFGGYWILVGLVKQQGRFPSGLHTVNCKISFFFSTPRCVNASSLTLSPVLLQWCPHHHGEKKKRKNSCGSCVSETGHVYLDVVKWCRFTCTQQDCSHTSPDEVWSRQGRLYTKRQMQPCGIPGVPSEGLLQIVSSWLHVKHNPFAFVCPSAVSFVNPGKFQCVLVDGLSL